MSDFAKSTAAYSAAHFSVDLCCAFFVLSSLPRGGQAVICLVAYNFCAFAMQLPLGILADRLGKNRAFALFGMGLTAAGAVFGAAPLLLSVLMGLGNALFHIGGGRDVLCGGKGRFSALGVFVSPGAAGLFVGGLMAGSGLWYVPAFLTAASFAALLLFAPASTELEGLEAPGGRGSLFRSLAAGLCLFAVVCLRSYAGSALAFPWKTGLFFPAALVLALALGKAAGGFLADRFGPRAVSAGSLGLSALLFLFYDQPLCGLLAVFLFNMTMPISLGAMCRLLPSAPGMGFGLLTFGLFLGALPSLLGLPASPSMPLCGVLSALVSLVLLLAGLRSEGERGK